MILNQHFSIAIAGLDGSYEFRFYASPKFASKRNYVVILNQTFFSIAIAGLNACYEFHFDTSFKFALKTILADFKSIFFYCHCLTWCEFRVSLWCKFRVCIKEEFSYDFKLTFFYCHCRTWCELQVPLLCEFWVCIKEEFNYNFKSTYVLLPFLDLIHVTSSPLIWVLSSHQRGIQLWFLIKSFSIAIIELNASSKFPFDASS